MAHSSKTSNRSTSKYQFGISSRTQTLKSKTSNRTQKMSHVSKMQRIKQKERRKYGIGNSNYHENWNVINSQKLESSFLGTPMGRVQSKRASIPYLSIGAEGQRKLTRRYPRNVINDVSTLKLWKMLKLAFIRPRNITFDRFFSSPGKRKNVKQSNSSTVIWKHLQKTIIFKIKRKT